MQETISGGEPARFRNMCIASSHDNIERHRTGKSPRVLINGASPKGGLDDVETCSRNFPNAIRIIIECIKTLMCRSSTSLRMT